jgi:predicted dithiol-disulfide oxidoreductase (DUF899 family)
MATAKTCSSPIINHPVVAHEQWLAVRTAFLAKEKEFTRLRDELSQQRRDLPWARVEKAYVFDGPNGKETLADLFAGESRLIVYHFMFGPDLPYLFLLPARRGHDEWCLTLHGPGAQGTG